MIARSRHGAGGDIYALVTEKNIPKKGIQNLLNLSNFSTTKEFICIPGEIKNTQMSSNKNCKQIISSTLSRLTVFTRAHPDLHISRNIQIITNQSKKLESMRELDAMTPHRI